MTRAALYQPEVSQFRRTAQIQPKQHACPDTPACLACFLTSSTSHGSPFMASVSTAYIQIYPLLKHLPSLMLVSADARPRRRLASTVTSSRLTRRPIQNSLCVYIVYRKFEPLSNSRLLRVASGSLTRPAHRVPAMFHEPVLRAADGMDQHVSLIAFGIRALSLWTHHL